MIIWSYCHMAILPDVPVPRGKPCYPNLGVGIGIVVHDMGARRRGSAAIGAGGVLFEDCGAAGRTQFVQLQIGALFVGGDPGVVRKAAENGIYRDFAGIPSALGSRRAGLQFNKG